LKQWLKMPALLPAKRTDREPHIGEYDVKTNAICDATLIPAVPETANRAPAGNA
jgi:hypothetical protein